MKKIIPALCLSVALAAAFSGRVEAQQPRPGYTPYLSCSDHFDIIRDSATHEFNTCLAYTVGNPTLSSVCAAGFSARMSLAVGVYMACQLGL